MKFGGLSESDVSLISDILRSEDIPFSIEHDQEIEDFNTSSIRNNLRHFTPPNISTNILAITIDDNDFGKLTEISKEKLLALGITDQVPSVEDFKPHTGFSIHQELADGPRKMVAFNFKHQLMLGILLVIIYLLKDYF